MRKSTFGLTVLAMVLGTPVLAEDTTSASADLQAEAAALGDCLVKKSTGEDRIAVAKWMLVALASGPQVKGIFKLDPALKVELDKGMAATFTRLMVKACPDESRPLFKARSQAGFEAAGNALGEIAIHELLTDPAAARELGTYVQYLNRADFVGVAE